MKTKYINVLFSFVIASFMMSCSSEIPTGDANKFSDMKSPEEGKEQFEPIPLGGSLCPIGSKPICAKFLY